ncbi:codeine O-demethylase-like [Impatiens glandulifera]|uniref:codeine O-demethylase-like n=1 Tax=Impatiens glandulifera TaxID=253017 RepID=UPI001FB1809B|nr:codeine O-demethylase-like [Impatiens glandulifera]
MATSIECSNHSETVITKSVKEMSINGDDPPSTYLVRESKFGSIDTSAPTATIPVIDLSLFYSSSSSSSTSPAESNELDKLRSALTSWGCFQLTGHGMSKEFLEKVRGITKGFFANPEEEKKKSGRQAGSAEGYGTDRVVSDNQILDWCDRLSLRIFPEDQRKLNLWPNHPENFSETLEEYGKNIKSIATLLFTAMAKSLNLETDSFSEKFSGRSILQARLILYPPCPRPDQVFGLKAHSDRSGVTILLQDREVEGLQVRKDDEWFTVPIIPDALFVNLGDQMQIMSNGIFKSPMHRVVTNNYREKISVALFNEPEPEKEIGPVDGLIDEDRPRLYRNVKNYAVFNYECFQKGVVAIEEVRVYEDGA